MEGRGTTNDLDVLPPHISNPTLPDNTWYFGAAYEVDEASYTASGSQQSSGTLTCQKPTHSSVLAPLDSPPHFTDSFGANTSSFGGNDLDSSELSSHTGPHSTSLNPAFSQDVPVPTAKQSPDLKRHGSNNASSRKRGFEHSVTVFSSRHNVDVGRKRNKFAESRRRDVALHREFGTCSRCRFRHVPVSNNLNIAILFSNPIGYYSSRLGRAQGLAISAWRWPGVLSWQDGSVSKNLFATSVSVVLVRCQPIVQLLICLC